MPDIATGIADLRDTLAAVEQSHVLAFFDGLAADQQRSLVEQLEGLDLDALPALIAEYVTGTPHAALPADIQPAPYYPNDPDSAFRPWDKERFRAEGEALLRAGKVACFTVAGGQGTRLGYDGPKGCYPAGAVTSKPLFQFFAEAVAKTGKKYGQTPPWYIMTSPLNHEATVAFFEEHNYFGLARDGIMFFPQGVMPSFDIKTGRMLMAAPDTIATSPDGHGGSLKALEVSGAIADMKARGVEHISYFQVDNPIVRVADPVFLGLHVAAPDSSGEMSSKMLAKAFPEEKLGMFCVGDGKLQIIEYSDLPMEKQRERLEDGRLRFLAGSPAIHIMSVVFVEKVNSNPKYALPYHRAEKKVPYLEPALSEPRTSVRGAAAVLPKPVIPTTPNAVKLERFVFDAILLADRSIVYEADRVEEFAPIKNAEGTDSPETSRKIQSLRAARWLEAVGAAVPWREGAEGNGGKVPECTIELSPLTGIEAADLREACSAVVIERGSTCTI